MVGRARDKTRQLHRKIGRDGVPAGRHATHKLVGSSRPIQKVREQIQLFAETDLRVLLQGETGTGKEVAARLLHDLSGRDPFVAVNCAGMPNTLFEAELFGHERGAFTGADRRKPGLIEAADRGTLFLDEIAEMPLALQPKLLRALEEGTVRRIGSTRSRSLNVRVVAATNKDLALQSGEGRFRDDLLYRLKHAVIEIPPLRERPGDIPQLVRHFLGSQPLSDEALRLLLAYSWPGNVRELKTVLNFAAVCACGGEVGPQHLPDEVHVGHGGTSGNLDLATVARRLAAADLRNASTSLHEWQELFQREYVAETVSQVGSLTKAAEVLGVDRRTLQRWSARWRREREGGSAKAELIGGEQGASTGSCDKSAAPGGKAGAFRTGQAFPGLSHESQRRR